MSRKKITSYPKEKINILFLENISEAAMLQFTKAGYKNVKIMNSAASEAELIKEIKHVHLLGIRSKTHISENVLKAATRSGVAVFNAPYSNTRSVAELVIGASIMLVRKITDKNKSAHEGVWMKDASGSHELRGKILGIIGYGNIGSQVSVLAEALGMKVLFYDAETKLPLGNASDSKTLKELLQRADVVTLHVPDLPTTRNLINKTTIKHLKKDAVLINYARGEVVDLLVLRKALLSGHLKGAAIDVFPEEPEKNGDKFVSVLQGLPNVILTPHIGGSTLEAQNNIGLDVSTKLFQYLEKGISIGSHSIPALALPTHEGAHRILHIHNNKPGVMSQINTTLSQNNINILGQYLKTNEEIGYVVLDVDMHLSSHALELLKKVKQTIKVRLLY